VKEKNFKSQYLTRYKKVGQKEPKL